MKRAADHTRLPVLLYHRVGPRRPGTYPNLSISPEEFRVQVDRMARWGYRGVRPADWVAWAYSEGNLPAKPVILTFDDGYADLAEFAFPVLQEYGFGGAVYVVTTRIGGANLWDQEKGSGALALLDAGQIREWSGRGIEFGAHSRTHADLTALSPEQAAEEVLGSKSDLERILSARVRSFAYPFGSNNETVREIVRKAELIAFTVEKGLNDRTTDLQTLRRSMVQPGDNILDLRLRLSTGFNQLEETRRSLADWKKSALSVFGARGSR